MARIARVVVPDFPHHVVQRGTRRMDVFFCADDRQEYINLLSQSASKHLLNFLAWCLMSNHAHFVVVPRQSKSLAATFGEAHRRYTRRVNFREGWRSSLAGAFPFLSDGRTPFAFSRSVCGDESGSRGIGGESGRLGVVECSVSFRIEQC